MLNLLFQDQTTPSLVHLWSWVYWHWQLSWKNLGNNSWFNMSYHSVPWCGLPTLNRFVLLQYTMLLFLNCQAEMWRVFSTVEDIQYCGGYHQYFRGLFSTVPRYYQYCGGITFSSTVKGYTFSTVEGVQYFFGISSVLCKIYLSANWQQTRPLTINATRTVYWSENILLEKPFFLSFVSIGVL